MKRRILINFIILLMMLLWVVQSASALTTPKAGYNLSGGMGFWTITDLANNPDGTSVFQLQVAEAAYESAFGLDTVGNISDPQAVTEALAVFQEGADSGDYREPFGSTFGFYYPVDAGNDGSTDYTFYTTSNLNTQEQGIEHIYTAYSPNTQGVYIYLADLVAANADWDWLDMTVYADGGSPRGIPEPATMLLFGAGLSGFAFFARKRIAARE